MSSRSDDRPVRHADRFVPSEGIVHLFRAFVVGATFAVFIGAYNGTAPKAEQVAAVDAPAAVKTAALTPDAQ